MAMTKVMAKANHEQGRSLMGGAGERMAIEQWIARRNFKCQQSETSYNECLGPSIF